MMKTKLTHWCKLTWREYPATGTTPQMLILGFLNHLEGLVVGLFVGLMRPWRASQRIAWRHSSASFSRMGRLRLYMSIAWGPCSWWVSLLARKGFLRNRRIRIILLTLLRYSLRSHSGFRPESKTQRMYLPLLTLPSHRIRKSPRKISADFR